MIKNNSKKNGDWLPWKENLAGFIISIGLFLFLYFNYDSMVFEDATGTKGKVMQHFLEYLDNTFGKKYVFGFSILFIIWTSIITIRSYLRYKRSQK